MAGDILIKYGTPVTLSVTNLQAQPTSADWTTGWTSPTIDNTTDLARDILIGANLYTGTSPTAGEIRVYAYAALMDVSGTPTWPDILTTGTEGTQSASAVVVDTEVLDSHLRLLWSSATDTSSDGPYPMPPTSIRSAFGSVPQKFCLFVSHNTGVNLKSTLQAFYYVPIFDQYT
jgi:hypothetical protein